MASKNNYLKRYSKKKILIKVVWAAKMKLLEAQRTRDTFR